MLTNKILNDASNILKERKKQAENNAIKNLQNALEIKNIKEVYSKLKEAEMENSRCEVYNEKSNIDINELSTKLDNELKNNNIDKKSLYPTYHCSKCNDTGYVNNKMCSCLKKEINSILYQNSGLKHKLNTFKSANLDIFDNKVAIKNLYSTMQKWCNSKDKKHQIILLLGKTGVGKTYLMECMADLLINKENIVLWTSAFNLNQAFLQYHTTFDISKTEYIQNFLDADYLFIDDLGTEPKLKNVTCEGLYNLISERIENGKNTIISTNLNLLDLESCYGDRIFSRLLNKKTSCCFNIENKDLRFK